MSVTKEQVEEWCQKNNVQLCATWSHCDYLWIEPDDSIPDDGPDRKNHLGCLNCADRCIHCNTPYVAWFRNPEEDGNCGECPIGGKKKKKKN